MTFPIVYRKFYLIFHSIMLNLKKKFININQKDHACINNAEDM